MQHDVFMTLSVLHEGYKPHFGQNNRVLAMVLNGLFPSKAPWKDVLTENGSMIQLRLQFLVWTTNKKFNILGTRQ